MAAVTQTANHYSSAGNQTLVTAEFTSPVDTNTWDTGLNTIRYVSLTIVESSGSASDALAVASVSGGTVTLDVQGTVGAARAAAWGD